MQGGSAKHARVLYAKREIDGLRFRPDARSVIELAIQGRPVEVRSIGDYINLYHAFDRLKRERPNLMNSRLARFRIGGSRWAVVIKPDSISYSPAETTTEVKSGRYNRYAAQLEDGASVFVHTHREALQTERAWHSLVKPADRSYRKLATYAGRRGTLEIKIIQA